MTPAADSLRLRRLDALLHREILRVRAAYELSLDELRGLYVSDERVDRLVDAAEREPQGREAADLGWRAAALAGQAARTDDPWRTAAERLGLSDVELDVAVLAAAPDIDLKYEALYAYVNNDMTRRWATRDLALRLFATGDGEASALRAALVDNAPLFARGLLRHVRSDPECGWLAAGFRLAPRAAELLLAERDPQPVSRSADRWRDVPAAVADGLHRALPLLAAPPRGPVLVLEGPAGSGRAAAVAALCGELGVPLCRLDVGCTGGSPDRFGPALADALLEARLTGAGLLVEHADRLWDQDGMRELEAAPLLGRLAELDGPAMLACRPGTPWRDVLAGTRTLAFAFAPPERPQRRELWRAHASAAGVRLAAGAAATLADRYALTSTQIRDAVVTAASRREPAASRAHVPATALARTVRERVEERIVKLAVPVGADADWDDLVLPAATMAQLREIAAAIRYRDLVHGTWGVGRDHGGAHGLCVLFAGPPGTGKTMAAGVLGHETGLGVYRVDLAGLVSKYIGETEKNLDRVLRAAAEANAMVLFDEADALFGRRSEVSDAHDRYANIEVAYLLQRIEQHGGVLILATNLRRNVDEAFARRIAHTVEFPLPDARHRERIWRGVLRPDVPLDDDLDLAFLARQFPIAGGEIANVALSAAFLAAQDGGRIAMEHLVRAMARQVLKSGRLVSPSDFKQYYATVAVEADRR